MPNCRYHNRAGLRGARTSGGGREGRREGERERGREGGVSERDITLSYPFSDLPLFPCRAERGLKDVSEEFEKKTRTNKEGGRERGREGGREGGVGTYIADVSVVVRDGLLHVLQRPVGFPFSVRVALLPQVEMGNNFLKGPAGEEGLKKGGRKRGG